MPADFMTPGCQWGAGVGSDHNCNTRVQDSEDTAGTRDRMCPNQLPNTLVCTGTVTQVTATPVSDLHMCECPVLTHGAVSAEN
jgi:hypothetical protein